MGWRGDGRVSLSVVDEVQSDDQEREPLEDEEVEVHASDLQQAAGRCNQQQGCQGQLVLVDPARDGRDRQRGKGRGERGISMMRRCRNAACLGGSLYGSVHCEGACTDSTDMPMTGRCMKAWSLTSLAWAPPSCPPSWQQRPQRPQWPAVSLPPAPTTVPPCSHSLQRLPWARGSP